MNGDRMGVVPNGRRADLAVFIQLGFKDDLIVHERFFFELADLCAQSGFPPTQCGTVLPGGGDGGMSLDVRLTLKTDDGALIQMADAWLNDIVCIGSGYLVEGAWPTRCSKSSDRAGPAPAPRPVRDRTALLHLSRCHATVAAHVSVGDEAG